MLVEQLLHMMDQARGPPPPLEQDSGRTYFLARTLLAL